MVDREKQIAFEREALVHLDSMYRVALRLTGSSQDAEDLVQEAVLRAYRSWDRYEPGTNARAWLLTILRHEFINQYRRRKRRPETVSLDAVEGHMVFRQLNEDDPEGRFFDQIVDEKVLQAIDCLPDEFREALVLVDVERMSYAEAAKVMDVPVGTVKSRLFRARQKLQQDLYHHAVEMGYIKAGRS